MFFIKTVFISILFITFAFQIRESKGAESCLQKDAEKLYSYCESWQKYNFTIYLKCMGGKGYDIKALMSVCAEKEHLPVKVKTFCDPNEKQRSIDGMCCGISEFNKQHSDNNATLSHLLDSVQICVSEMVQQGKNQ